MKKKGTTESYSALIGVIIAFLMLTAIGFAAYNIYKPKSPDSFNKLVNKLKTLEKSGNEEGEYPLFLEEEWFVVGFDKTKNAFEYKQDCPPFFSTFYNNICDAQGFCPKDLWGCYGFGFSRVPGTEGEPTKILKPKQKCGDKGCLCLCKIDKISETEPFLISEQACLRSDAICASFDSINFIGGEGCCHGVFIPGVNIESAKIIRGLKALNYKKSGNDVSLRDLSQSDFAKILEKEKQRIVQLSEYLKTRRNVYFVPINWNLDMKEFNRTVNIHLSYTQDKIREVEKISGQRMINNLLTDFNVWSLENLQCKNVDINPKGEDIKKGLTDCLVKSDLKLTEESLKDAIIIGLTTDTKICELTDSERVIISNYMDPVNTAHEWGHFMLFCDEYKYSKWEKDEKDGTTCLNPYPLCCKDHPNWENDPEGYKKYLENEKIALNCYPIYEELSDKAKSYFGTKEKYEAYISKSTLCSGHVCQPQNPNYKYCRGMMGPELKCEDKEVIYSNSLEYSYLDFDKRDDFRVLFGIKKTE